MNRRLIVVPVLVALLAPASAASASSTPSPAPSGYVDGKLGADPATASGVTAAVLDFSGDVLDIVTDVQTIDGSLQVSNGSTNTTVTVSADVLFAFNQATLTPAAKAKLADVAQQLHDQKASGTVLVGGHADSKGSASYNLALSKRRAAAVVSVLGPLVSDLPVTLAAHGYGDTKPVAPNTVKGKDNPAGRKLNRRVTVEFGHAAR